MNPILTALESGEQLTTAALMARFGVRTNVAAYMRGLMAQAPGIKCDYVKRCRELRWWMPDRQPKTDHQLKMEKHRQWYLARLAKKRAEMVNGGAAR